jgi:hypothetical protein
MCEVRFPIGEPHEIVYNGPFDVVPQLPGLSAYKV